MNLRFIGIVMVVTGCGGFGFAMAAAYRRELTLLSRLIRVLNDMEWELQYRLTPLPELCRMAAREETGILRDVFLRLAQSLDSMRNPDVKSCMQAILSAKQIPSILRKHLKELGTSLGRFDLQGQILGLRAVRASCRKELNELENRKTERIKEYRMLALCAGAAIAVLMI